jgi:Family of unknown function (DUF6527)
MSETKFTSKVIRRTKQGFIWWCPGCKITHQINVGGTSGPQWSWDGNAERPTFSPSVLVSGWKLDTDDEEAAYDKAFASGDLSSLPPRMKTVCHTFIRNGAIQFLDDCAHHLKGQTVPIPAWPYASGEWGGILENDDKDEGKNHA